MDLGTLLRFAFALLAVLTLIVALGWVLRRYGVGGAITKGSGRRIGIVETAGLDAKRRLVLIQRDGVEHLLLLSPTRETVVERGIGAATGGVDRSGNQGDEA